MFFKFKNQNLNANWLLVDPVREDSVLDVTQKAKSEREHHESNNSVCVCACAFHDNEKREKYVRLFSKVLDEWNATVLQEKEPMLWCCPSIYFTCMDNLYVPHTVCIGFANKQTVAATIAHTVTSHSTQRLAKIKVKELYLLIMLTLLWIKGGVAWSKHKTCFIAFSNNATTRTSLKCYLVKRTAPKHTGGKIKSKIQRSFLRLPAVHKKQWVWKDNPRWNSQREEAKKQAKEMYWMRERFTRLAKLGTWMI